MSLRGGGTAGAVAVDVEGDYTRFRAGLEKEGAAAGNRAGRSFGSSFGRQIASAGAAYLGASFAKSAISEASDLAEAMNVTGLAFGDARASADAFAKSAATTIGMSEAETRALQAQLGNVIAGFGASRAEAVDASEVLIRRAADIGSAWNASTQEVSEAITAAFTTSTEPIRRFGVIIDEAGIKQRALELGLISAGGELDANAKRLAVTSLILESTNNVAGDFANTQDGVANSAKQVTGMWKDMQAQLGTGLLPVLSGLLGIMKQLGPDGMRIVVIGGLIVVGFAKIAQAGTGLSAVFNLLAANPWVIIAAAVVAAGVAIYRNWDTIKAAGGRLIGWFSGAASAIGSAFAGIAELLTAPFRVAFNGIAWLWNHTIGKIGFTVPSWVPFVGGKGFHVPQIPELANGGLATSPMLAMIGEYSGAKSDPEVVSPVSTMRDTMLDALATAGAGGGDTFHITVNGVDLSTEQIVAKIVEPVARALERRTARGARGAGRPEVRRA